MNFLYAYFLVPLAMVILRILARFSPKVRDFLHTREGLLDRWRKADLGKNRLWFHVSSVGELEQIRPVLEALAKKGNFSLLVSYYSLSVPRLVKDWSFARYADYLPLDNLREMRELVAIVQPRLLVLNRYDLWPNHLRAAKEAGIPIALVNASTPPLGFFGFLSLFLRSPLFRRVDFWTYVDSEAAAAWEPFVRAEVRGLVAGNPRVDRALLRVEHAKNGGLQERLRYWRRQEKIVAGSTWPEDEAVVLKAYREMVRDRSALGLVLVPHEPHEEHLLALEQRVRGYGLRSVRFSQLLSESDAEILLIDGRGFLAELYGVARIAYVGGGFGREVHSVIEPLAHGLPVAFGPHHHRSPEAQALLAIGAAFIAREGKEKALALWLREMLGDGPGSLRARESLQVYLGIHRSAGERVGDFLAGCLENSMVASNRTRDGEA